MLVIQSSTTAKTVIRTLLRMWNLPSEHSSSGNWNLYRLTIHQSAPQHVYIHAISQHATHLSVLDDAWSRLFLLSSCTFSNIQDGPIESSRFLLDDYDTISNGSFGDGSLLNSEDVSPDLVAVPKTHRRFCQQVGISTVVLSRLFPPTVISTIVSTQMQDPLEHYPLQQVALEMAISNLAMFSSISPLEYVTYLWKTDTEFPTTNVEAFSSRSCQLHFLFRYLPIVFSFLFS